MRRAHSKRREQRCDLICFTVILLVLLIIAVMLCTVLLYTLLLCFCCAFFILCYCDVMCCYAHRLAFLLCELCILHCAGPLCALLRSYVLWWAALCDCLLSFCALGSYVMFYNMSWFFVFGCILCRDFLYSVFYALMHFTLCALCRLVRIHKQLLNCLLIFLNFVVDHMCIESVLCVVSGGMLTGRLCLMQ